MCQVTNVAYKTLMFYLTSYSLLQLASETHVMFSVQEEDTSSSSSGSLSKGVAIMRVRAKTNSRKDPWRRHTLSDVDLIRQVGADFAHVRLTREWLIEAKSRSSRCFP